jgi:hypothetical protein
VKVEELNAVDAVVYLTGDCPVEDTCLGSSDSPEFVNWYNISSSTQRIYAAVRGKTATSGTVRTRVNIGSATTGNFCSNAIPINLTSVTSAVWSGNLNIFVDGFTGGTGCAGAVGPEVWFAVTVPAGNWLTVENGTTTAVALQVLAGCTTNDCLDAAGDSLFWHNDGSAPATVMVVAEGDGVTTGALALTFETMDTPATMFPIGGPSEATGGYWGATDADVSMCPNITSTGTLLSLTDDSTTSVAMGISFPFFGSDYSSIWVGSNGVCAFGTYGVSSLSGYIPDTSYGYPEIAVYWRDLQPAYGGVYARTVGDTFEVQWNIANYSGSGSNLYDFRMVLNEASGIIDVCYIDTQSDYTYADYGADATAGIEGDMSHYLAYSNHTPVLTNGLHVWYVPGT